MRTTFIILAALVLVGSPRPAAAQPPFSTLAERPAAGLALGRSGYGGGAHTPSAGPQIQFVADAPILPGLRIRGDVSRVSWTLDQPDYQGGVLWSDRLTVRGISITVEHLSRNSLRHLIPYAGWGYGIYHFSHDRPIAHPWRDGAHFLGGFEAITPGERYAIDTEVRLRMIRGLEQWPVNESVLLELDAAVGMKIRF